MKKTNTALFFTFWVVFFAAMVVFFNYYLAHRADSEIVDVVTDDKLRRITLKANSQHHYIVQGKINGISVKFIVDTGASVVSVPASLANKMKLKKYYPITLNTANGLATGYLTRMNLVQIGPIQLNNVKGVIVDDEKSPDVLLGMSALKNVQFSQRNGQLTLIQKR